MSHLKEGFGEFLDKLTTLYGIDSGDTDKRLKEKQSELEKEHSQKLKQVDGIQKKLEKKLAEIDKKERELSKKENDISSRERKHREDALQRRENDIREMIKKIEDQHGILTKQEQEKAKMMLKKEKTKDSLVNSQKFDYEDDEEGVFDDLNSIDNRLKNRMGQIATDEEPEEDDVETGELEVAVVDGDEDDILNKIASLFDPSRDGQEEEDEEDEYEDDAEEEEVDEDAYPGTIDKPFGDDEIEEYEDVLDDQDEESLISDTSGAVDILTKLKDKLAGGPSISFGVSDGTGTLSMGDTEEEEYEDDEEYEDSDGAGEEPEEQTSDEIEDEQEEYENSWNDEECESEVGEEMDESEDEDSKEKILAMMRDLLDKKNDPDDPQIDKKTGKGILFGDEDVDDNPDDYDTEEEGYSILPPIDRERYTDIEGLEPPSMRRSGKVLYYDPKKGKYYDRDTDMYLSDKEVDAHDNPPHTGRMGEGTDILDRLKKAEEILNIMEAPGDPNDMAPPSNPDAPVQQGDDPLAGPDAPIDDGSEPLPEDGEDELPIEFEDKTKQIEDAEDYDISANNAYDFYDRIRGILNDEESIKALNQEYETIPMKRRKITPAKYLHDKVINNIKEKRKRIATPDMGGGMGGDMGMGGIPDMGGGAMGAEVGAGGPMGGDVGGGDMGMGGGGGMV